MLILHAYLQRVSDGKVVRIVETHEADHTAEGLEFMWTEGNSSCDCNRALFVADALGEDVDAEPPCGDDRYKLLALVIDGRFYEGATVPGHVDAETTKHFPLWRPTATLLVP